jgi:hypothetical protein
MVKENRNGQMVKSDKARLRGIALPGDGLPAFI